MARSPLPIEFSIAGEPVSGETCTGEDLGPCVAVLTTTSADLGLSIHSTYVGDDRLDEVLVSEVVSLGPTTVELHRRRLRRAEGMFTYQRRRPLYDHLQRVVDVAAQHAGVALQVRGADVAARALDPLAAR